MIARRRMGMVSCLCAACARRRPWFRRWSPPRRSKRSGITLHWRRPLRCALSTPRTASSVAVHLWRPQINLRWSLFFTDPSWFSEKRTFNPTEEKTPAPQFRSINEISARFRSSPSSADRSSGSSPTVRHSSSAEQLKSGFAGMGNAIATPGGIRRRADAKVQTDHRRHSPVAWINRPASAARPPKVPEVRQILAKSLLTTRQPFSLWTNPRFRMALRPTASSRPSSLTANSQTPLLGIGRGPCYSVATITRSHRRHESHELTWCRSTEAIELSSHVPMNDGPVAAHSQTQSAEAVRNKNSTASQVNQLRQLLAADSNFVGRLTDDVVRRIERSVRIDRARRGI